MSDQYKEVLAHIRLLTEGEDDWIAILSTVSCELFQAFENFHWVGFYRVVSPGVLKVGPYQGGHGCLEIAFGRGVCGTAAESRKTICLGDVDSFPGHIACSSSTRSELVVPVLDGVGNVLAVLDIDSDEENAFTEKDVKAMEELSRWLGGKYLVP